MSKSVALIVGAGPGISLAFAEALVAAGYAVGMASRNLEKLRPLAASVRGRSLVAGSLSLPVSGLPSSILMVPSN